VYAGPQERVPDSNLSPCTRDMGDKDGKGKVLIKVIPKVWTGTRFKYESQDVVWKSRYGRLLIPNMCEGRACLSKRLLTYLKLPNGWKQLSLRCFQLRYLRFKIEGPHTTVTFRNLVTTT
jgi:hypothetical protein